MIRILGDIPHSVAIAVSGGVDSMAVLDFLRRSPRDILVLHYNHGTLYAPTAELLVKNYCAKHNLKLVIGKCEETMPAGVSPEAWWRKKRYSFFEQSTDLPVITAHHLEDAVEGWVFTSLNGNPFLIPRARDRYLRPFLTTRKQDLLDWCERKNVPVVEDPSNEDIRYKRNYIRNMMMPHILEINPGIHKTIKKKLIKRG